MAITRDEVHYIARLARLSFSDEEEARVAEELSTLLDYVDQLRSLDTSAVPPMSHVLDVFDVTRDDEPVQRISHEEALRPAPDADADHFRVPKVIG